MKESQLLMEVFYHGHNLSTSWAFFNHLILQQFKYKSNGLHSVFPAKFPFLITTFISLHFKEFPFFSLMAFTEVLNPVFIIWVDSSENMLFLLVTTRGHNFPENLVKKKKLVEEES